MKHGEIDNILASEEELVPSSGFLGAVMHRVEEEASAPPPIPFPWKRALPGIVLALAVLAWGTVTLVRYALEAGSGFTMSLPDMHLAAPVARPVEQAAWVVGALIISAASWLLSRRLAGGRG
ncbi:MAG TPA: hypothetical protein VKB38_24705 [Terracidiphilus sp.]|nr:hypothetical protein [Terracidiphilus sp.]